MPIVVQPAQVWQHVQVPARHEEEVRFVVRQVASGDGVEACRDQPCSQRNEVGSPVVTHSVE